MIKPELIRVKEHRLVGVRFYYRRAPTSTSSSTMNRHCFNKRMIHRLVTLWTNNKRYCFRLSDRFRVGASPQMQMNKIKKTIVRQLGWKLITVIHHLDSSNQYERTSRCELNETNAAGRFDRSFVRSWNLLFNFIYCFVRGFLIPYVNCE